MCEDNGGKIGGFEARAPYKCSIYSRDGEYLTCIGGFDRAAVEDADGVSCRAVAFREGVADEGVHGGDLVAGGGEARANGPHGLVGDHEERIGLVWQAAQELRADNLR